MIAQREPWYADIADVLADESEYMLGLCEYNRIIMEQALGNICGACGGAGIVAAHFDQLTCPDCQGSGEHHTPADEPVTDAALIDAYLDGLAAREPAYNDRSEG